MKVKAPFKTLDNSETKLAVLVLYLVRDFTKGEVGVTPVYEELGGISTKRFSTFCTCDEDAYCQPCYDRIKSKVRNYAL
jgi:hypothetical protein